MQRACKSNRERQGGIIKISHQTNRRAKRAKRSITERYEKGGFKYAGPVYRNPEDFARGFQRFTLLKSVEFSFSSHSEA